jgi:hypothetical protein
MKNIYIYIFCNFIYLFFFDFSQDASKRFDLDDEYDKESNYIYNIFGGKLIYKFNSSIVKIFF